MIQEALALAARGISVFPLRPGCKTPRIKEWQKARTTDTQQITEWWTAWPNANIGIALGKISGIVAIDLDGNHGATEEDYKKFPRTVTTKTKNGYHFFYMYPAEGIRPHEVIAGSDGESAAYLRSDGQYVVGPGSTVIHDDGTEWEYQSPNDLGGELDFDSCPIAELPEFCKNTDANHGGARTGTGSTAAVGTTSYPPNTRHGMFLRTATGMWADGVSVSQIRATLFKRNATDCKPPKPLEELEHEVEGILQWLTQQPIKKDGATNTTAGIAVSSNPSPAPGNDTAVTTTPEEFIIPLGYRDQQYFYTSSDNQTVIALSGSGHTCGGLQQLLPPDYWQQKYGTEKKGPDWNRAGGELMAACRAVGYFQEDKIRDMGCWLSGDGSLIIHAGDRLIKEQQEYTLNGLQDGYIYRLGARHEIHTQPLTLEECAKLVRACNAPKWRADGYGNLLAGGLGVLRLCGALRWRPMFWLTGASGTGKSTLMEQIIKPIAGEWAAYVQGQATEAGIRQQLRCSSRPVIFDEAETTNEKSGKRIGGVIELARQGSSISGGRILKGTPNGSALTFRVNSSFLLSSIRVNLTEEADLNRFCLLELDRPDPTAWPAIAAALGEVDEEYGDRLFARFVRSWGLLERIRAVFEEAIVSNGEDRRRASQYGIILAGYWLLISDTEPSLVEAAELSRELVQRQRLELEQESDEELAIDHLLEYPHRTDEGNISLRKLTLLAQSNTAHNETLSMYGMAIHDEQLCIHTSHRMLADIYKNSRWTGMWDRALIRTPGATRCRTRIGGKLARCIKIPLNQP